MMLKFFRKYQLIFLAIGGSLLMVVFLLEPLVRNLTPNPLKRTVASIGPGAEPIKLLDIETAREDMLIFERFGIDALVKAAFNISDEREREHWFLLTRAADRAGLVGHASDGSLVIDQFASAIAQQQIQRDALQSGTGTLAPERRQQIADEVAAAFSQRAAALQAPEVRINQAFSRFAGVQRLVTLYGRAVSTHYSEPRARLAAAENADAALVDLAVIGPEAVRADLPEPTDDDLWAHVQRHVAGDPPGPLTFDYALPPRLKLEYLRLDAQAIRDAVPVDRVELRARWGRENPGAPADRFEADKAALERTIRSERAEDVVDVADQIIRGELIRYRRSIENAGEITALPEDWRTRLPDFAALAQRVVDGVKEREGVDIPLPSVVRREDWLTPTAIAQTPGLAQAAFRVGSSQVRVSQLAGHTASLLEGDALNQPFLVRVGVPIDEPPFAFDSLGNRYYLVLLDARPASPPDSLEDVRDQARDNWVAEQAYERLTANLPAYAALVETGGLDALAATFAASLTSGGANPVADSIARDVWVYANVAGVRTPGAVQPDRRAASAAEFRDAVREAARRLDPLAPIDSTPRAETTVPVAMPSTRAVAVAVVRAYRPVDAETYRAAVEEIAAGDAQAALADLRQSLGEDWPFNYGPLAERMQFTVFDDDDQN